MLGQKNTKEAVLQRLYNQAVSFWGVDSIEELDPLAQLLMQGLASLIYDVHNEIEDINVRLLESLSNTLTPSALIDPRPAHSIAQAFPVEPEVFIDRKTVFQDKKLSLELREKGIEQLSFAPVMRVRLISGNIKYLITERYFNRIEENGEKQLLGQAHTLGEQTNNTVWIGLDTHQEVKTLEGIPFFFDFPRATNKYDKFKVLPYSKWSIAGRPLTVKAGLPVFMGDELLDEPLFYKNDLLNRIDQHIADIYNIQYLTIDSNIQLRDVRKEPFPEEIIDLFPEHVTAQGEPCYWIKIVLPAHISIQDIHDIRISLNAFPIAQKTFYSLSRKFMGIVPLQTKYEGEYFIGVENVSDSYDRIYKPLPFTTTGRNDKPAGTYSIKRGGIERLDNRNAGEYMERMINLMRDEVVAFSSLDTDKLRNVMDEMQEGLKQLDILYGDSPTRNFSTPDYLILDRNRDKDKDNEAETVFVEYWSTHCELANGLRSGKMLTSSGSLPLDKNSVRLLSMTKGGKQPASVSGRMDAFRYVLTSREQLVTQTDIENFSVMNWEEKSQM